MEAADCRCCTLVVSSSRICEYRSRMTKRYEMGALPCARLALRWSARAAAAARMVATAAESDARWLVVSSSMNGSRNEHGVRRRHVYVCQVSE